jgi:hypothetical protein
MYSNLRPAAQVPGVYEVVGVWVAGDGVGAASGSAFGTGTWLIAVDARASKRRSRSTRAVAGVHTAHYSQVAGVPDHSSLSPGSLTSKVILSRVCHITVLNPQVQGLFSGGQVAFRIPS